MTADHRVVRFSRNFDFLEAAQLLWTAVRIGEDPRDILDFVMTESLLLDAEKLPKSTQVDAFRFIAQTREANRKIATKIAQEKKYGPSDAIACWQTVTNVVFAGKSQADSFDLIAELRRTAKHSAESNLYNKANYRQLQNLWQRYKPVLHLAEAAVVASFAEDPALKQLFRSKGVPTDAGSAEKRSNHILETLCSQGRIDAPYVVGWE